MEKVKRQRATVLNRVELADRVSEELATTRKAAQELIAVVTSEIIDALMKGEAVSLPGLGAIAPIWRNERLAHNPKNPGERVIIPGHTAVRFCIARSLKQAIKVVPRQGHYLRAKSRPV